MKFERIKLGTLTKVRGVDSPELKNLILNGGNVGLI